MKIGVLVLMAGRSAGGPETYEVRLLRALAKVDRTNEYFIYCTGPEAKTAIGIQQENFVYRVLRPSVRPLSVGLTLPLQMIRDGVRFLHSTFTPPPFSTKDLFYTVHCLSSLKHPEWYEPATAFRLNLLLQRGIRKARHLACVSRYTLDQVHDTFGIPKERMLVSYNGVDEKFQPLDQAKSAARVAAELPFSGDYILYVGKLQAHKNIVRLLQAYDMFRSAVPDGPKLLLCGRAQGNVSGIEETLASLRFRSDVIRAGYVPGELLPHLYSGATMFVYPSLWEGFGIPIVEAMASGTPVITSTATCLPEVAGDAALLADPNSTEELAGAMTQIATSPELRRQLRTKGLARAAEFSWEACAMKTIEGYQRMVQ